MLSSKVLLPKMARNADNQVALNCALDDLGNVHEQMYVFASVNVFFFFSIQK